MNRVEIDIQGSTTIFPINPIEYQWQNGSQFHSEDTLNDSVRFETDFDDRSRVMTWRNLPNKSLYRSFYNTLKTSIGISGVRINHRDLDITGDQNQWKNILVQNVNNKLRKGAGAGISDNSLNYDFEIIFKYI